MDSADFVEIKPAPVAFLQLLIENAEDIEKGVVYEVSGIHFLVERLEDVRDINEMKK